MKGQPELEVFTLLNPDFGQKGEEKKDASPEGSGC